MSHDLFVSGKCKTNSSDDEYFPLPGFDSRKAELGNNGAQHVLIKRAF